MKSCTVCGAEWPDDTKFCPNDGSTLRTAGREGEMVGSVVADRYHIEKKLGEGGMGAVYLGEHVKMGRRSAIKVISQSMANDPEAIARFNREAANAARINHPNVCAIYDFGETPDGTIYLAMEFIEGQSLDDLLHAESALSPARAVDILRQTADALDAAHHLGIVHRDLKPDNIMLASGRDGADIVKVVDFGIAKAMGGEEGQNVTKTGLVVGTPEYMSPEQLSGDKLDGRSDVYSLALVFYRMVTGGLPFQADTAQETMIKRLTDDPLPMKTVLPSGNFPDALQVAVDRGLARMPGDRHTSAGEFSKDVERAVKQMPTEQRAVIRSEDADFIADELWQALGAVTAGAAAAPSTPKKRAIVVLPFTNQSADPENEYFSDGLTEELIADLATVGALSVISRTSSMQLKGTDKDVRALGRELGVRYVLEGSVRKAGTNLRITAQLIDALSDEQLWADKYAGTMDDVFDLQERVSRAIVDALDVTLSSDEDRRLGDRPVKDPRAFEWYLQARQEIRRYNVSAHVYALLEQAIAIEGRTTALKALEGWAKLHIVRAGLTTDRHELDEAEAMAHELLREAPDEPHGHHLLGYVAYERGHNEDAVRHFRAALTRAPNDADSLFMLGIMHIGGGVPERGEDFAAQLIACDPLAPLTWLYAGTWVWFVGRAAEGVEKQAVAVRLDPDNIIARWSAGYTDALAGRTAEADVHATWMETHAAQIPYTKQLRALLQGMTGQTDDARATLAAVNVEPLDAHQKFHLAESYAMAGDDDRAIELLDVAVEGGFYPHAFIAEHCPFFAPIRSHERFPAIAARAAERTAAFREAIDA